MLFMGFVDVSCVIDMIVKEGLSEICSWIFFVGHLI